MIILEKVKGTMQEVPSVEINIDTVYLREKITKVPATEDFPEHWEYQETQMTLQEYIDYLRNEVYSKDLDNKTAIAEVFEMLMSGGVV